jgi:hypothetical protein
VKLNIAHSIFKGLNDTGGIMFMGYEWGESKTDQKNAKDGVIEDIKNVECTFSNKYLRYGAKARSWRYDNRIKEWFKIFGHSLDENNPKDFDKAIIQTNWCNTMGHKIEGSISLKLSQSEQISNFLGHVSTLKPKLIFFFGSAMIDVLNNNTHIKESFIRLFGDEISYKKIKKDFNGRKFYIGFQSFAQCDIISLPHPSSSRGLQDKYIELFSKEIGDILTKYRKTRGI